MPSSSIHVNAERKRKWSSPATTLQKTLSSVLSRPVRRKNWPANSVVQRCAWIVRLSEGSPRVKAKTSTARARQIMDKMQPVIVTPTMNGSCSCVHGHQSDTLIPVKKKKKSYFLSVDTPRIQFGKPHYNKLWLMQIIRIRNVPFHHILHGQ